MVWLEYQRQIRTAVDWYKKCTSICSAQRASGGGPVTFRVMGPHLLATFPLPLFQFVRVTFISRARPQERRQQKDFVHAKLCVDILGTYGISGSGGGGNNENRVKRLFVVVGR